MKQLFTHRVFFAILAIMIWLGGTSAWADTHHLVFASDRHGSTTAISTAMSCWKNLSPTVEYVSMIGDMVGEGGSDAPAYDVNTVYQEAKDVFQNLTTSQFSIIWGSHDGGFTDTNNLGVMKCATQGSTNTAGLSGLIFPTDGSTPAYYIYAISYDDMRSSAEPEKVEAFKSWVSSIDESIPVIVLCHVPIHAARGDNKSAYWWNQALNFAATGFETPSTDTEVTRNVIFLHGHNHTTSQEEFYYEPGESINVPSAGSGDKTGTSTVIQYTYLTAGYMRGATNASLVTITDDAISFTKSKSGTTRVLGEVDRVNQVAGPSYMVTFDTDGGSEVASQKVKEGRKATKPTDPTKNGFAFDGWYLDGEPYDFSTPVTNDITLVAMWKKASVKTIYVLTNNVTAGKKYLIVNANTAGNAHAISSNAERAVSDQEVIIKQGQNWTSNQPYIETSNSYAVWNTGTSSGSYTFANGEYFLYHSNRKLSLNTNNSNSTNWSTDGTSVYYRAGGGGSGSSSNLYLAYNNGWTLSTTASNVYFYEEKQMAVPTHTVTFHSNGGTAVEPQEVTENEPATKPATPTRGTGSFIFGGWYTEPTFATEYTFTESVTADMELYAKWDYDVTISKAGYATLYLDIPVQVPQGLDGLESVYYISGISDGKAHGSRLQSMVPALTGVVIKGAQGTYLFPGAAEAVTEEVRGNLLTGSLKDIDPAKELPGNYKVNLYTLGTGGGTVHFGLYTGTNKLAAYKAYMIYSAGSSAKTFTVVMDDDATGISVHQRTESDRRENWYTLQGVRLNGRPVQHGIYICNGKRIVVK